MSRTLRFVTSSKPPLTIAGMVAVALGLSFGALAYFTGTGSGNATANAGSLLAPTTIGATAASPDVTVAWDASTLSNGVIYAQSYTVERYDSTGSDLGAACGGATIHAGSGSGGPPEHFTCSDSPGGAGAYKYKITAVYHQWSNRSGFTSTAATVFGPTTRLVFTSQPVGGVAEGSSFTTSPVVKVEDAAGNVVTTDTGNVTLALNSGPGAGSLTCSNGGFPTIAAVAGVAAFTSCQITGTAAVGTYTLVGTRGGLTSTGASSNVVISVGSASKLVFTTQPVGGVAEATSFGTSPAVSVEDAYDNLVASDTGNVTLAINSGPGAGSLSCSNGGFPTVAAVSGVATFTSCQISGTAAAGTYTLAATRGGLTSTGASSNVVITFGTASKLAFTTQPVGSVAETTSFATSPVVSVEDSSSNVVTSDTGNVTLAILSGPGGGSIGCSNGGFPTIAAVSGVAAFTSCQISGTAAAGTYALAATRVGLTFTGASSNVVIKVGAASLLAFTTQPVGGVAEGTSFGTSPAVSVEDASGNVVTTDTGNVTLAIGTGPGSGTLGCSNGGFPVIAAVAGVATFTNCQITGTAAAGTYTLAATRGGLTTATSGNAVITFGTAAKLAFTTQPVGGVAEATSFGTSPAVSTEDSYGNVVTSDTGNVTLAINSGPGAGSLSCSNGGFPTVAAVSGVAAFTSCQIGGTAAAGTYTLAATRGGLTSTGASSTVVINIGSASKLVFTTQPVGGVAEATSFGTSPVVKVQDSSGNVVTSDTGNVTLAINSGPGAGSLSCSNGGFPTVAAVSGVATFTSCQISGTAAAGTYTLAATRGGLTSTGASSNVVINVGSASKLAFTTQPVGGVTEGTSFGTSPAVSVEDASGNVVTSDTGNVTLAINSGPGAGSLSCSNGGFPTIAAVSGVATFTSCQVSGTAAAGTYTLAATRGGLTTGTSGNVVINVGSATKVAFTTQPVGAASAAAFATQPVVTVQDANGNTVTSSSASITLAIASQASTGAVLACTTNPLAASSGVSTFAGCQITGTTGSYTISAAASGLTGATRSSLSIATAATGLSPTSGAFGTTGVTIGAAGFLPSHALTVTVGGFSATVTGGGTSGTSGSSTVTFTIPIAPTGAEPVVVSDGTNSATSGTNFTITGPSLTVSKTAVSPSGALTATFGSVASPLGSDWIAVYTPVGQPSDNTFQSDWVWDKTCAQGATPANPGLASGSCSLTMPAGVAAYQVRLLRDDTSGNWTILAVAPTVYVENTPTVTAVSPAGGPTGGGSTVTVTGTGLGAATAVNFGATAGTNISVNGAGTSLTVTSPAHSAGQVDVTVVTPVGTSTTSFADLYTFEAAPTVTAVSPVAGVTGGGTSVTLTGTNFIGASAVAFGANPGTSVVVSSSTSITVTSPSGSTGTVDVTVTTPVGTSPTNAGDHYTYEGAPTLTSISPASGSTSGGTSVTITGTNLIGASAVTFGANPGTSVVVNSSTSVTVTSPTGSLGTVDVTVTTPLGTSALSSGDVFTYNPLPPPTVTAVSPDSGPNTGGTSVVITGISFTATSTVKFGSTSASSVTVNSATSITATAPAGSAGTVDVTVTNAAGTSSSGANDKFTYTVIIYEGVGPVQTWTTDNAAKSVTYPTATATGDLLLLIVTHSHEEVGSCPAGWTARESFSTNNGQHASMVICYKFAVNGESGSTTVSVTSGGGSASGVSARIADYRNVNSTTPFDVSDVTSASAGSATTFTPTGLTTATAAAMAVSVVMQNDNAASQPTLSLSSAQGFTAEFSNGIATSTSNAAAIADQSIAAAGAVTFPTWTSTQTPANSVFLAASLALRPVGAPTVTGVSPNAGPIAGATSVTLTGTNFLNATGVNFGANAGTSVVVNSATSITVTAPSGSAGLVDVTVTTPGGTSATGSSDHFTYDATPTVSAASPTAGPTAGATSVTVTGTGFLTATGVKFGSNSGTGLSVVSDTSLTITSPSGSAGAVDVTVTNPTGTSATNGSDQFTYVAAPTVTGVSPTFGVSGGGTSVTVTGTHLTGATAVNFGASAGSSVSVNGGGTSLTVNSPSHAAGQVDVTVVTPGGTSATSSADHFTFETTPTVTAISPAAGTTGGGTSVTVTGTGFLSATGVKFGANSGTSLSIVSDTSLTIASPSGSAGTAHVIVISPSGTSATGSPDLFTYDATPTVSGISPTTGTTGGGTSVTVTGTGFLSATSVSFGANAGTSLSIASDTSLTITSPAGIAGTAHVTVTNPTGTSSTGASDLFTYNGGLTYAGTGAVTTWLSTNGAKNVAYPAGTATNDLLFLVIIGNQEPGPASDPAGWTATPGDLGAGSSSHMNVYYKLAGAGDGGQVSVTPSSQTSSGSASAWVIRYSQGLSTPALATGSVKKGYTAAGATLTPTMATTNTTNAVVISIVVARAANTLTLGTANGFTLENATTTSNGTGDALGVADFTQATAGTPTAPVWNQSGTAAVWSWTTHAFK